MKKSAIPKYRFKSVLDITVADLQKMGAKAVGLDIDNTIAFDGTTNFVEGIDDWIKMVTDASIPITIVSNSIKKRVSMIGKLINLPFIASSKKPMPNKLYKAAEMMNVDISEFAMIGDQLFADIMAANRAGAIAVRVDPMQGETRWARYYAWRRGREVPYIKEFEKNHGYGVYDD
ncbi:MAG: YqeG family HAD IIIA-type phosphatase [Oscillospiraceae bacterium]